MLSLEVELAGVKMRSPVGVAALSPLQYPSLDGKRLAELLLKHVEFGAGFIHTPYTNPQREHPRDKLPTARFLKAVSKRFGVEGMWATADSHRVEQRLDSCLLAIDILKKKLPADVPVIANIIGPGADAEGWAEHAAKFEGAGADLIELDVSCPLPAAEAHAVRAYITERIPDSAGVLVGDQPLLTAAITKAVSRRCHIPVGVKLSPEVGFPRLIGFVEQLKEAGARFVTSVNGPLSVAPPDIYNGGKSPFPFLNGNSISAVVGPWTRFLCYRNIGTISMFIPEMEQAAVGGLVEDKHIVEAIMLGAKITELSSGVLWRGWGFIKRCNWFLNKYMKDSGYESVEELRGKGIQYMKPVEQLDWGIERLTAVIEPSKCTGCRICAENLCYAIYMEDNLAKVNDQECSACNLCVVVCPEDAIVLKEIENKPAPNI